MKCQISVNDDLKSLLNTPVGYVKINKYWINHNNSYECAAWWEDSRIEEGVYPLLLKQNRFAPYNAFLQAKLQSVVIDDFFPALWAGSTTSNTPYKPQNIGEKRNIYKEFDIIESINNTGNIEGNDIDVCVNPFVWESVVKATRQSLSNMNELYQKYIIHYHNDGDGNHNTNLSMIEYCSNNIKNLAKAICIVKNKQKYSEYMGNTYSQNIIWTQAA